MIRSPPVANESQSALADDPIALPVWIGHTTRRRIAPNQHPIRIRTKKKGGVLRAERNHDEGALLAGLLV